MKMEGAASSLTRSSKRRSVIGDHQGRAYYKARLTCSSVVYGTVELYNCLFSDAVCHQIYNKRRFSNLRFLLILYYFTCTVSVLNRIPQNPSKKPTLNPAPGDPIR